LIGNLFRDQQKKSVNHTMLIFITARLVNSQGAPWKPQNLRNHGLVDFNR
jgi:type II secretory pathway component GspD/PulD (secretin)